MHNLRAIIDKRACNRQGDLKSIIWKNAGQFATDYALKNTVLDAARADPYKRHDASKLTTETARHTGAKIAVDALFFIIKADATLACGDHRRDQCRHRESRPSDHRAQRVKWTKARPKNFTVSTKSAASSASS